MNRKLLALYGLKWDPFSPETPDEALWRPPAIDDFCWRIEQKAREGGFALITGDSGTGKSIALRLLARHLAGCPELAVGTVNRPQSSLLDFYRELGEVFGVPLVLNNRCWMGFKTLREKWEAHLAATLWRPVLLVDEAQEMDPRVLSELRLLASTHFDSRSILTVVLAGDGRLLDLFRLPQLVPLGSRIRPRLLLEYVTPKELAEFMRHILVQAGNPRLMTEALVTTLCEHAAGNYRVLCNMGAELLAEGLRREVQQLDEKLYLEVFAPPTRQRGRADVRKTSAQ
jgi:type II secretory pathway predicted ATPase ExeA